MAGWSRPEIPSLTARQQYVRFLFRPGHWEQAADAIAAYREALTAAHGEGTGWMEEALNLTVDLERGRNSGKALPAARDLLALEESLAGKTSEPCLRGLEVLASATEQTDDPSSAAAAAPQSDRDFRPGLFEERFPGGPTSASAAAQLLSRLGQLGRGRANGARSDRHRQRNTPAADESGSE